MKALLSIVLVLTVVLPNAFGQTKKDSLYVFVGERIEVKYVREERKGVPVDTVINGTDTSYFQGVTYSMDRRFVAKYKILQVVYGSFKEDTIEFVAYDHYGIPAFSKYKHVLLYVSNYNGKLYHEKYQFADVYKTKNGRWASGYRVGDYGHAYNNKTTIKPEPIDFIDEVYYENKGWAMEQIAEQFPPPYYIIKGSKAIIVLGNYVEELFGLKKSGVLKARGIFD